MHRIKNCLCSDIGCEKSEGKGASDFEQISLGNKFHSSIDIEDNEVSKYWKYNFLNLRLIMRVMYIFYAINEDTVVERRRGSRQPEKWCVQQQHKQITRKVVQVPITQKNGRPFSDYLNVNRLFLDNLELIAHACIDGNF